jgi:predicted metalloprotease with PDZ domain
MSRLLFVFLLFPFCLFSRAVHYEVTPLFGDGSLKLQVRVWFAGDADGATELALPNRFGGAENLSRCIQNLACTTPGASLSAEKTMLQHAPGQEIKLYYEVAQDVQGVTETTAFRPILQPDYFHVLGKILFIAPRWNDGYDVTVAWRNFPENWSLHNSFGSQSASQHFFYHNLCWRESIFVGGDYRIREAQVQGKPVCLVIRGEEWGFHDDTLLSMFQRTVSQQCKFWEEDHLPRYTVTLTPFDRLPGQSKVAYFGTGLTNSFAAFATPHAGRGLDELCRLFHHELMHHWIGCKIRCGGTADDMPMAWFTEGFTEYFALKNMLAGGFINDEQYMSRLNGYFLGGLYRSPHRELPNRSISERFFSDTCIERLPYLRGCVFAFFLDNAIKSASDDDQNLHALMLDLLEYYQRPNRSLQSNFDFFMESCSEYLQTDAEPLYQKHIVEGKLIPADNFALPPYLKMKVNEEGLPFFELDKNAAGWELGLRE